MNESPALLNFAAWLGAVVERTRHQQPPFPLDQDALDRDQRSFGFSFATSTSPASTPYAHRPCPSELAPLFRELLAAFRASAHESDLWFNLLISPFSPPEDVLEDLIQRDIHVTTIGHLPLSDRLLWKLADQVPEALLTLGKRRFLDPDCSPDRLEEVLHAYPHHRWLLNALQDLADEPSDKSRVVSRYLAADDALRKHQS